jgi:hypothetical protein
MNLLAKKAGRITELLAILPRETDEAWEWLNTQEQVTLSYIRAKVHAAKLLTYWEYRDLEGLYEELKNAGWET